MEGTVKEVLVEGPSKTNPDKLTSRTRSNHIVIFSGPKDLIGQLINVRITEAKTFSLFGEMVKKKGRGILI
jgi:tRNA-2-methylthio-N6-dimethylallyladenosine synthase